MRVLRSRINIVFDARGGVPLYNLNEEAKPRTILGD